MYRSSRPNGYRGLYGKLSGRSLLAKNHESSNSTFRTEEQEKANPKVISSQCLQTKVLQWDEKLPISNPPPLSSLVEYLVGRHVSSKKTRDATLHKLVVRSVLNLLGLTGAHKRLCSQHSSDPVQNCWYTPGNHGDTFGIRQDEMYFHENIIPCQPVTSYSVLIRGNPQMTGTSVDDGIGARPGDDHESLILENDVMVNRATSLIGGLMKARDYYMGGELTQDKVKTTPLSMQWYNYIFSCSMQFYPGTIIRYKAHERTSRHIIVMVRGNMYKLDMLCVDEKGQRHEIGETELKNQLKHILLQDSLRKTSIPIAVLTSLPPSERWRVEQRVKCLSSQNDDNLALLRDAIFVVALDQDSFPRNANETMFALHSGNFMNRWYDKSVQLVVFGNGVAGFVNNYLAGMTGTVGTNFIRLAVGHERRSGDGDNHDENKEIKWPESSPLYWRDSCDNYIQNTTRRIIKSSRTTGPFKQLSRDVFKICNGFNFEAMCRGSGSTPGAAFQAGLQLALARTAGRLMSVNEVVSIRHLRFGGMTLMDASMADMQNFIDKALKQDMSQMAQNKTILKSLLIQATQSYKDEVLRYKKGYLSLWLLDSLYRQLGIANRLPDRANNHSSLRKTFLQRLVEFCRSPLVNILPTQIAENVTSNPLWFPEIEAIGRPGVMCILPPTSMALHYMFGREAISITINANLKHPAYGKEEEFAKELEISLLLVKDLLEMK